MFITFEGCEGCGKSTHINLLARHLETQGHLVVTTREPGGTAFGKKLREILLSEQPQEAGLSGQVSREAELFLFAADRSEHVEKIIRPALAENKIVLCDRFVDSTCAYQIGGRGLPEDLVHYVNFISSGGLVPDLTIFLDLPPEKGLQRVALRGDVPSRFDQEQLDFHRRVFRYYRLLAEQNPARICCVDADGPIDKVQARVIKIIQKEKLG
jgi:dTMP kinase